MSSGNRKITVNFQVTKRFFVFVLDWIKLDSWWRTFSEKSHVPVITGFFIYAKREQRHGGVFFGMNQEGNSETFVKSSSQYLFSVLRHQSSPTQHVTFHEWKRNFRSKTQFANGLNFWASWKVYLRYLFSINNIFC